MYGFSHQVFFELKHRLERRYTTSMVCVSWGKPLNLLKFSYEACTLSSRYSFGGGARDRPVSAQTFMGRSTSKCLNKTKKSNAPIEISINWCMERGHMNLHRHHCRLMQFCFFSPVIVMQSEKNPHEEGSHVPLMRGTVPLLRGWSPPHDERVSRTEYL